MYVLYDTVAEWLAFLFQNKMVLGSKECVWMDFLRGLQFSPSTNNMHNRSIIQQVILTINMAPDLEMGPRELSCPLLLVKWVKCRGQILLYIVY